MVTTRSSDGTRPRAHGDVTDPVPGRADAAGTLATIAAAGPLVYIALTVGLGLLWDGYDPVRQTQSELGGVDSPYRTWMNLAFAGLGLTILAFALAYHLRLRWSVARWVAVGLLVVAGAGMVTVAFFPCDPGCVDVTTTGRLHGMFSAPGAIGIPAAAMVSSLAFERDGRISTGWRAASFWVGTLSLLSGPVVAAGLLPDVDGVLQRAGMWTGLLWMAAVAGWLRRAESVGGSVGRRGRR